MQPTGVLVMAYGSPSGPDDVAAYYTDVRRGRPPSPEQLAELIRRYEAIGGISPLAARSAAQVDGIGVALEALAPGRFHALLGTKHGEPRLEATLARMAADGIRRCVGLVLAPHYSALSVGEYLDRARTCAARLGMKTSFIEDWYDDPTLVELLAARVLDALAALGGAPDSVEVLFSAHSLPARILSSGDPYPAQVAATAALVAEAAGIARYRTVWQSAARTPEPWLGPDLVEVLGGLALEGVKAVVICPVGFTSDHLEILYDIDVSAQRAAEEAGLALARTASLNDDPALCAALARRVVLAAVALDDGA